MKFNNKFDGHSTARALAAYLIVIIVFGIFLLFLTYKENIINSNSFTSFMMMTIIGMGFLAALLYLVSKPVARKASRTSKKKR